MAFSARLSFIALLASTLAFGCAVGVDDEDSSSVLTVQDTSAEPASVPGTNTDGSEAAALPGEDPVYFGQSNSLESPADQETAPSYTFELVADAHMTLELSRRTEEGPATIGFTLYRVTADEQLMDLETAVGHHGSVAMSLYTVHGGLYAIQLLDGLQPESLVLNLACNSGTCAPRQQPGDACGEAAGMQCDKGLVCVFAEGACQTPEAPKHCAVAPTKCSSKYAPVCGCDGRTWGNDCFAMQAGVSILASGECPAE